MKPIFKYYKRDYTQVCKYLPELEGGKIQIKHFQLTAERIRADQLFGFRDYWLYAGLQPDYTYTKLIRNGEVWMSDTPMEKRTNSNFLNHAHGDVLIFGLGIGLIIYPLLECDSITSITVVELDPELIKIVSPYLKHPKLKIMQGDAFDFFTKLKNTFNTIYFDIWVSINSDNYEDQKLLHRKYRKFLKTNGLMDSWMKGYYQREKTRERRERRERYSWY